MNEEIESGLLQDVHDLDPAALSASPGDGTDTKDQRTGGDSDGTDSGDADGTDSGDADGTDGDDDADADETDGDGDGEDNA